MRLAAYNVENLFDRAKAMNLDNRAESRPVLEKFAELNALLGEIDYTPARRRRMVQLMIDLGLEKSDTGPVVILRRNRGGLLRRPQAGGLEITASGRAEWSGSLELRDEPVDERAMRNTARVMKDVKGAGQPSSGSARARTRSAGRGYPAMPFGTTRCGSSCTRWPTTWLTSCAPWPPEEVEHWSLTTLREKLVKIGARIVRHGRYVVFQLAEVAVPRALFADILRRIDDPRPKPPPLPA